MSGEGKENLKTGAVLIGVLAIVSGVAFAAGNYPTRSEWDASREKTSVQIDSLKLDVNNIKIEQAKLRSSIEKIEGSQIRSEGVQTEIRKSLGVLENNLPRRKR